MLLLNLILLIDVTFSTPTGVIATLRLLFAREGKGKSKFVLKPFFANYPHKRYGKCRGQRVSELRVGVMP